MEELLSKLQDYFQPSKHWHKCSGIPVSNEGKHIYAHTQKEPIPDTFWRKSIGYHNSKDETLCISVHILDNKKLFAEYRIYPDRTKTIQEIEELDPIKKAAMSFVSFLGQSMKIYNSEIELFSDIHAFLNKRIMPESNISK